jgi:hypothetical protein
MVSRLGRFSRAICRGSFILINFMTSVEHA